MIHLWWIIVCVLQATNCHLISSKGSFTNVAVDKNSQTEGRNDMLAIVSKGFVKTTRVDLPSLLVPSDHSVADRGVHTRVIRDTGPETSPRGGTGGSKSSGKCSRLRAGRRSRIRTGRRTRLRGRASRRKKTRKCRQRKAKDTDSGAEEDEEDEEEDGNTKSRKETIENKIRKIRKKVLDRIVKEAEARLDTGTEADTEKGSVESQIRNIILNNIVKKAEEALNPEKKKKEKKEGGSQASGPEQLISSKIRKKILDKIVEKAEVMLDTKYKPETENTEQGSQANESQDNKGNKPQVSKRSIIRNLLLDEMVKQAESTLKVKYKPGKENTEQGSQANGSQNNQANEPKDSVGTRLRKGILDKIVNDLETTLGIKYKPENDEPEDNQANKPQELFSICSILHQITSEEKKTQVKTL